MGSWNTMATRWPLGTGSTAPCFADAQHCPSPSIFPWVRRPSSGSISIAARQHKVFPDPLSPTKARLSPKQTERVIPFRMDLLPMSRLMSSQRRAAAGGSEGTTQGLLAFDGLKERLEVSLSEALSSLALDNLKEHRRPVDYGFCENLQKVAFVVAVN